MKKWLERKGKGRDGMIGSEEKMNWKKEKE